MPTPLGIYLFFVGALFMIVGGHDELGVGALALGVVFELMAFFIGGVASDDALSIEEATDGSR